MKRIFLFYLLSIFLPQVSFCFELVSAETNGMELNFDELEEQALQVHAFNNIEHKPLHPLMVWMRIIGSPLVNAYFTMTKKIKNTWQQLLYILQHKDYHERSNHRT